MCLYKSILKHCNHEKKKEFGQLYIHLVLTLSDFVYVFFGGEVRAILISMLEASQTFGNTELSANN